MRIIALLLAGVASLAYALCSPPTLTFNASPLTINSGGSSTLSWSTTDASTCTASGAWSGTKGVTGGQSVAPTATSTYSLSCSGPAGTVAQSVTVTVSTTTPAPTITLSANPTTIAPGGSSTLTWSTTNATSCTSPGYGTVPTAYSFTVTPASTTTYSLTCTGAGGTTTQTVTVTVSSGGGGQPTTLYTTSFAGTENPISEGGAWTRGLTEGLDWTNPKTTGGQAVASTAPTPSRYSDDIAHLSGFPANQWAQATVYKVAGYTGNGGGHEVELLLRFQITPHNARGYEVLWGLSGYLAIVRWNGPVGSYTPLYDPGVGSIPVPQHGDVLRAEITGSTIKVYRNGVQVASVTDTTYATGNPGIGFWPVDGAIPDNLGWQDFSAGGL